MTTIRDVAAHAGVSTTTVSHVINGTRRVDAGTAARVEAAIEALGYRPNALARSMRRGQTHTVGIVLPDIAKPFFGDLARNLEDHMYAAGYSSIICNSDGDVSKESAYLEVLLSKKVDGLLLVAASQRSEHKRLQLATGPPTVVVDRELGDLPVSQVLVDNRRGGYLAGRHLLELGHRDIAVVAGPSATGTSPQRLGGFCHAIDEAGMRIAQKRIYRGDFRAASGRAAMEVWLRSRTPPTAVFAENDLMAIGVLSAAHAAGIDVPAEISVVGFDGIAFGADVTPPLTTVAQSTNDVAATAVELLFERLSDGHASPAASSCRSRCLCAAPRDLRPAADRRAAARSVDTYANVCSILPACPLEVHKEHAQAVHTVSPRSCLTATCGVGPNQWTATYSGSGLDSTRTRVHNRPTIAGAGRTLPRRGRAGSPGPETTSPSRPAGHRRAATAPIISIRSAGVVAGAASTRGEVMAEAVAKVRNAVPGKEATARSGARDGRSKGASARVSMDDHYRFIGANAAGLTFERRWTTPGVHPYDEVTWELRDASIANEAGKAVFEQKGVEVPSSWSQLATNVVVSKYFRGHIGSPSRERSVKQLIDRVVNTITSWAATQRYFASDDDLATFKAELTHLLLHQKMAFNSPVWFNVGVEPKPQCSACFINSVQDSMSSIMDLAKTEAMLFKYGSGAGVNLSPIRGSREKMSGGGVASGPVSFMKGFDAFAGVVKSGGKTRRAAKMVILDASHPDILDFVDSKASEERKAWALIEAGYDPSFTGEAYGSVFFQNANHSVRASDDFMRAVVADADWKTYEVTTGEAAETYKARTIFRHMAEAAWICGDPGIQYDTTINDWNPVANTDRQYATNPCSEFSFLNDTSCNLASLNLMKFADAEGEFDAEAFRYAARITITAQEILVDNASYPTAQIEENSHRFRPLGLGYANLGALLMSRGLAYDSEAGRAYAGAITAIMTGEAYRQSAIVARDHGGAFNDYAVNEGPFLRVIGKHRDAAHALAEADVPGSLVLQARAVWDEALELGQEHGYRNAQVTVLAPTGTIAFMMDCDTTGVEPDIALIKYKKLVGEGFLKIVNGTVPLALQRLGYTPGQVEAIVDYIDDFETIEGAADLKSEHLPVFDCAFKPVNGERSIGHMGHLRMMSATQPFLSGAISKTVNMPEAASAEDIEDVYLQGWKLGLKAIAIYRDGSKRSQPLSTGKKKATSAEALSPAAGGASGLEFTGEPKPYRRRLPDERRAITHKYQVAGHEGYVTVGLYPDGQPGEIFLKMAKEGSTVSGLMDTLATMTSIALQYGVPLRDLVSKFTHVRFEPSGFTGNPEVPIAKSIVDYIFRWMGSRFLSKDDRDALGIIGGEIVSQAAPTPSAQLGAFDRDDDATDSSAAAAPPASSTSSEGEGGERAAALGPAAANGPASVNGSANGKGQVLASLGAGQRIAFSVSADSPSCMDCGSIMVRSGSCYKCLNCGATSGCS